MCLSSSRVSTPDTSAQTNEAQREYDLQQQLARDQLAQQDRQTQEQRAVDEARYKQQLEASQAEANRQYQAQQDAVNRQAQQLASLQAQQEAEARAREAQAAQKASDQRAYATGRAALVDDYKSKVDSAYAGYNDDYFSQFAKTFADTFTPQVEKDYGEQRRDSRLAFSETGNLNSSAAARTFGELAGQKQSKLDEVAAAASTQAGALRGDIDQQKRDSLASLFTSGAIGQDNLPDGMDPGAAVGGIGSALSSLASGVSSRASSVNPNGYIGGVSTGLPGVKLPNARTSAQNIYGLTPALPGQSRGANGYTVAA